MIKAVIFDMDGTMVNSEVVWNMANTTLAERRGLVFEDGARKQMMGKKDSECLAAFKEYYKLDTPVEELVMERRGIMLANLAKVQANQGLFELLDLLDRLAFKKAVATSSFTEYVDKVLAQLGIRNRFDAVVTGDMVTFSKPNPEMFLEAAKRIGIEPSQCLVLEDAQNGIEAAFNAGMQSIALPHEHNQTHDFSKATKILPSMLEVNEQLIRSL